MRKFFVFVFVFTAVAVASIASAQQLTQEVSGGTTITVIHQTGTASNGAGGYGSSASSFTATAPKEASGDATASGNENEFLQPGTGSINTGATTSVAGIADADCPTAPATNAKTAATNGNTDTWSVGNVTAGQFTFASGETNSTGSFNVSASSPNAISVKGSSTTTSNTQLTASSGANTASTTFDLSGTSAETGSLSGSHIANQSTELNVGGQGSLGAQSLTGNLTGNNLTSGAIAGAQGAYVYKGTSTSPTLTGSGSISGLTATAISPNGSSAYSTVTVTAQTGK